MAPKRSEVSRLTRLVMKGAANKTVIEQGSRFRVFAISGRGATAVVKKEMIPSRSGKDWPMTDSEYRGAVKRAHNYIAQHEKFGDVVGEKNVPKLLAMQMRIDRPGSFSLQRRIPVLLRKRRFTFKGDEWMEATPFKMAPPKVLAAALPDIVSHLIKAERAGEALDAHLGNWVMGFPKKKNLEQVLKDYSLGKKRFRIYYCDTYHRHHESRAVLADSLPLLLKSIRFHYPKKYPQFERIALSQLRKKCGKEKVDEIVARLREMRLARKELKEKHNEMLRKMQS